MKCNTAILFVALTLAMPGAVNAAATVAVLNQMAAQKQKEREDQLEAVERDALAQPAEQLNKFRASCPLPDSNLQLALSHFLNPVTLCPALFSSGLKKTAG